MNASSSLQGNQISWRTVGLSTELRFTEWPN